MNCTHHFGNPITSICIAQHKCPCQRKLCVQCLYDHGVFVQEHTILIQNFQEKIIKKLNESTQDETFDLKKQRMAFKQLLSRIEIILKQIQEDLSESINNTYDQIEKEYQSYANLIIATQNIAEFSYTDLEKLVSIFLMEADLNTQKNTQISQLEKIKNEVDQEIETFVKKQTEIIKKIQSFPMIQFNQVVEEDQQRQENPNQSNQQNGRNDIKVTFDWGNQEIQELKKLDGHEQSVESVCYSPDGITLASGSDDRSIRLWDIKTGLQKAKLDGHTNNVWSVCFSFDGSTLASGSGDKSICLWDVNTGKQKTQLNGHRGCVNSVCFSPDGINLASSSHDKTIRLWDVKTGQLKSQLEGHSKSVLSVCFSPNGTTLASGSSDKTIRLWDVKTGELKAQLDGHDNWVQSVCFSPDSTILASGSSDNSIRLWDVIAGQQKAKLDGHSGNVNQVCFSPDGTTLASGSSNDKSIFLWDVQTGQQITKLDGHTNYVHSVCFSPDGTTLASGSWDNSIRLWGAQLDK